MKRLVALVAALAAPMPVAHAVTAPAKPLAPVSANAQADALATFLVPKAYYVGFGMAVCTTELRSDLAKEDRLAQAEKDLPGIKDYMLRIASGHCRRELPKAVIGQHELAKLRAVQFMTPRELQQTAALVAEINAIDDRFEIPAADLQVDAATIGKSFKTRFTLIGNRLKAMRAVPARREAALKLSSLISEFSGKIGRLDQDVGHALREAYGLAMRSANVYARERGAAPIYQPTELELP